MYELFLPFRLKIICLCNLIPLLVNTFIGFIKQIFFEILFNRSSQLFFITNLYFPHFFNFIPFKNSIFKCECPNKNFIAFFFFFIFNLNPFPLNFIFLKK